MYNFNHNSFDKTLTQINSTVCATLNTLDEN